ncbi:saccharopine dehydrogenase NADP-binding domain-containing protein [Quadrisphaera sp. KR29]|uniref:saccharopine dehydrogenase NADP-binding domain-containing protein n=1 Tax=Quadrisphaera sp. KR29 TaxID=3461391 RepID=UPI004044D195
MVDDAGDDTGPDRAPDVDVVLLGATGFTGRLAAQRLAVLQQRALAGGDPFPVWAVAGRDRGRLEQLVASLPGGGPPPVVIGDVDVHDDASLGRLAARSRVLLNAVGPYTATAQAVVGACVAAGTHCADLSGELPLLRRVVGAFHDAARAAGCQVVQLAGWEALPPDVAGLHACRAAVGAGPGEWGPGAGAPVDRLDLSVRFHAVPRGVRSLADAVSAGTLASVVEVLTDPGAGVVGDPAALLPSDDAAGAAAVRRASPLRVRPHTAAGRLLGPVVPVAFLDPPVLHRTAALLAREAGEPHRPARVREGIDSGAVLRPRTLLVWPGQVLLAAAQRGVAALTRMPLGARSRLAAVVRRRLPAAGTGPSAAVLHGWRWEVAAQAVTADGRRGAASLRGTGHPGYTATAALLVALGLEMAERQRAAVVPGVVTPAVAFGPGVSRHLSTPELSLHLA